MKAKIDPESPWCKVVYPREKRGRVKAVRMVGNNRNPGAGGSVYLHIEGISEHGRPAPLLHISGKENLRAVANMILDGIKPKKKPWPAGFTEEDEG